MSANETPPADLSAVDAQNLGAGSTEEEWFRHIRSTIQFMILLHQFSFIDIN